MYLWFGTIILRQHNMIFHHHHRHLANMCCCSFTTMLSRKRAKCSKRLRSCQTRINTDKLPCSRLFYELYFYRGFSRVFVRIRVYVCTWIRNSTIHTHFQEDVIDPRYTTEHYADHKRKETQADGRYSTWKRKSNTEIKLTREAGFKP